MKLRSPFIMIALGGCLGALSRFYLNIFIETDILNYFDSFSLSERFKVLQMSAVFANFPFGILLINMLGSFILGVFLTYMQYAEKNNIPLRNFFVVGFLGSLTTFSTFIIDSMRCLLRFVMHSASWQDVFPHLKTISHSFEQHFSFYTPVFLLSHSLLFAVCNILLNLILCLLCVGLGYRLMRKSYGVKK